MKVDELNELITNAKSELAALRGFSSRTREDTLEKEIEALEELRDLKLMPLDSKI